jgi:hypothetical protein
MINDFTVKSLTSIKKIDQDSDIGVVRVSTSFITKHAKRNALLKITNMDCIDSKAKSIVRIARAYTLKENEIALQYDDRLKLGINKAGDVHRLQINQVNILRGLLPFLWNHTSPLVHLQTALAVFLFIFGLAIGYLLGFLS